MIGWRVSHVLLLLCVTVTRWHKSGKLANAMRTLNYSLIVDCLVICNRCVFVVLNGLKMYQWLG